MTDYMSHTEHSENGWAYSWVYEAYAAYVLECGSMPIPPVSWEDFRLIAGIHDSVYHNGASPEYTLWKRLDGVQPIREAKKADLLARLAREANS